MTSKSRNAGKPSPRFNDNSTQPSNADFNSAIAAARVGREYRPNPRNREFLRKILRQRLDF